MMHNKAASGRYYIQRNPAYPHVTQLSAEVGRNGIRSRYHYFYIQHGNIFHQSAQELEALIAGDPATGRYTHPAT